MSQKTVTPKLGANSFSCPHCGAQAHQTWFRLYINDWGEGGPWYPDSAILDDIQSNANLDNKQNLLEHFKRILSREVFFESNGSTSYSTTQLSNVALSRCFSCKALAIWRADRLLYPAKDFVVEPNPEMPADVLADFEEASAIVSLSPRGAAALLRLAIQKLMIHLNQDGKNLNENIGDLVKAGLDPKIQKSLDLVRVVATQSTREPLTLKTITRQQ
jgi:uncharacterized protein DUF4145